MLNIDYKNPNLLVCIKNKLTNEIMVNGYIKTCKDLPELAISFDYNFFFKVKDNPLYSIAVSTDSKITKFNSEKYKDYIYPYKLIEVRNNPNEYIHHEFSIDELDPEVASLVYTLNRLGFRTTGSCCGHGTQVAWIHISFDDFLTLKKFIEILQLPQFKHNFQLTTSADIIDNNHREIRLSLQTMEMGNKAYEDISRLDAYLSDNTNEASDRINKLNKLKI